MRNEVSTASATPIPPGIGTSPARRLVATVTTRQTTNGSGVPMAWRMNQRVTARMIREARLLPRSPRVRLGSVRTSDTDPHASLRTGTTRSRSRLMRKIATTAATIRKATIARISSQAISSVSKSISMSTAMKAMSRIMASTTNPDKPSIAPWETARVGGTPYLRRKSVFIVMRPAALGMARPIHFTAT